MSGKPTQAGIHRLSSMGVTNCYLIEQEATILVDAGLPAVGLYKGRRFLSSLKREVGTLEEISLVLLTHGHWDHIGLAHEVKKRTGAKVAIHQREKEWVEEGLKPLPSRANLWGRIILAEERLMLTRWVKFPGVSVDLAFEDEGLDMEPLGIHGRVYHTPGHTSGSVSLLLDTGEAFVGDLAMNGLPWRFGAGMPIMWYDKSEVRQSWRLLLDNGARWIYPAHGKPFKADALRRQL
jgi:hydroxyacylglutathione hydrolase